MSCYFFLTQREKSKYFHNVNQEYRTNLQPDEQPGSAPRKKKIGFKSRVEVLNFWEKDKCNDLGRRKSVKELYRAEKKSKLKRKRKIKNMRKK